MADFISMLLREDDHGRASHPNKEATTLWRAAVESNPNIVIRYGEFSSELLQAMLGIHVPNARPKQLEQKSSEKHKRQKTDSSLSNFEDEMDRVELAHPHAPLLEAMHRGGASNLLHLQIFF